MEQKSAQFGLDICLAVPPFHQLHMPPLGPSILKPACQARGLNVKIVYGGFLLAAQAGFEPYDVVSRSIKRPKIGERLFRPYAYPPQVFARLPEPEPLADDHQAIYDGVADTVAPALDAFVKEVLTLRPRILGISSCFEQNLASSALARRVKSAAPEICIVMGGANAAWPMTTGLADVFPWIDYFFAGEADIDFPDFCERLIHHGERPAKRIVCSEPIRDMRMVFTPDFSDFFTALHPLQVAGALPPWLPLHLLIESSRGCWWGAKQHCTFCGLNGDGMNFREKPAARVLDELKEVGRWQVGSVRMADNIMPHRYLTDLFPSLADTEPRTSLFYEVKANLTEEQVDVMALGGVTMIQPGIESLSSNVLRIMRKGVSAHQNIALLRSCAGIGLRVVWNIIYGFPGEAAEDYATTVRLLPFLEHLQPPDSVHTIQIDRYSPYFMDPEGMGIGRIQPFQSYRALYPTGAAVGDIAYHFAGNYSTALLDHPDLLGRLHTAAKQWKNAWVKDPHPLLQVLQTKKAAVILDTRRIARQAMTPISREKYAALLHFERPRSRADLGPALEADAQWLLARDFLIEHEEKLLSVVVRPRPAVAAVITKLVAEPSRAGRGQSAKRSGEGNRGEMCYPLAFHPNLE